MELTPIHAKDMQFMKEALQVAERSKCLRDRGRARYGAVIIDPDGFSVTNAYNGKPCGSQCDEVCFREGLPPNAPKANCCVHAETNAVIIAGRTRCKGGTMYCTEVPCIDCFLNVANAGIHRICYLHNGTKRSSGYEDALFEAYIRYKLPIKLTRFTFTEWELIFGATR